MKGAKLIIANSISAFLACSTAGAMNAWFMRQPELQKGIDIHLPHDGKCKDVEILGKSRLAAKMAVTETAISRYILTIPILFPALALYAIERKRLMPSNFYAQLSI